MSWGSKAPVAQPLPKEPERKGTEQQISNIVNSVSHHASTKDKAIENKVRAIIVDKLGVSSSDVQLRSSFQADFGADSLDAVELIMEFEKEFNLAIPDEMAERIRTVNDAVNYINQAIR